MDDKFSPIRELTRREMNVERNRGGSKPAPFPRLIVSCNGLYCSPEKETEGGRSGGWRQSATGNLKSCANTRVTGEGMVEREDAGGRREAPPPELESCRGWKKVVRSRNYVVASNPHPNDSWMIKGGRCARYRFISIVGRISFLAKFLIRFVPPSTDGNSSSDTSSKWIQIVSDGFVANRGGGLFTE